MPTARLVLEVANRYLLVGETGSKLFGRGEQATRVAAHVNNQRTAGKQVRENVVQVALAKTIVKRGTADVAYIVVQNTVVEARGYAVVGAEIAARQRVREVGRIILAPGPVAAHVEGCVQVDMAVTGSLSILQSTSNC